MSLAYFKLLPTTPCRAKMNRPLSPSSCILYIGVRMFVVVASLKVDVGLVCFNRPARFSTEKASLHCESDALQHEPSRLLRNANASVKLIRANAVLAIHGEPHRRKP